MTVAHGSDTIEMNVYVPQLQMDNQILAEEKHAGLFKVRSARSSANGRLSELPVAVL
jgi:hypothetical protein